LYSIKFCNHATFVVLESSGLKLVERRLYKCVCLIVCNCSVVCILMSCLMMFWPTYPSCLRSWIFVSEGIFRWKSSKLCVLMCGWGCWCSLWRMCVGLWILLFGFFFSSV
jgi:hypothetical protein